MGNEALQHSCVEGSIQFNAFIFVIQPEGGVNIVFCTFEKKRDVIYVQGGRQMMFSAPQSNMCGGPPMMMACCAAPAPRMMRCGVAPTMKCGVAPTMMKCADTRTLLS